MIGEEGKVIRYGLFVIMEENEEEVPSEQWKREMKNV